MSIEEVDVSFGQVRVSSTLATHTSAFGRQQIKRQRPTSRFVQCSKHAECPTGIHRLQPGNQSTQRSDQDIDERLPGLRQAYDPKPPVLELGLQANPPNSGTCPSFSVYRLAWADYTVSLVGEHLLQCAEHLLHGVDGQLAMTPDEAFCIHRSKLIHGDVPESILKTTGHPPRIRPAAGCHRRHDSRPQMLIEFVR